MKKMSCYYTLCQMNDGKCVQKNWFGIERNNVNFEKCLDASKKRLKVLEFVLAAGRFVAILDTQTNPAFKPVRERFMNNVDQMANYLKDHQGKFIYLDEMIDYEQKHNPPENMDNPSASRGLLWFTRASQFLVEAFFNSLKKPKEPLSTSMEAAYEKTLINHHKSHVKTLFDAAMLVCPSREDFYACLCGHDDIKNLVTDAKWYFHTMDDCRLIQESICNKYGWNIATTQKRKNEEENGEVKKFKAIA